MARPTCLRLLAQARRAAASRTFCTAGSNSPMSTAMMAMTTNSSISVKAERRRMGISFRKRADCGRGVGPRTRVGPGGAASVDLEVERVRPVLGDLGGQGRLDVVRGGDALLELGVARVAGHLLRHDLGPLLVVGED